MKQPARCCLLAGKRLERPAWVRCGSPAMQNVQAILAPPERRNKQAASRISPALPAIPCRLKGASAAFTAQLLKPPPLALHADLSSAARVKQLERAQGRQQPCAAGSEWLPRALSVLCAPSPCKARNAALGWQAADCTAGHHTSFQTGMNPGSSSLYWLAVAQQTQALPTPCHLQPKPAPPSPVHPAARRVACSYSASVWRSQS